MLQYIQHCSEAKLCVLCWSHLPVGALESPTECARTRHIKGQLSDSALVTFNDIFLSFPQSLQQTKTARYSESLSRPFTLMLNIVTFRDIFRYSQGKVFPVHATKTYRGVKV